MQGVQCLAFTLKDIVLTLINISISKIKYLYIYIYMYVCLIFKNVTKTKKKIIRLLWLEYFAYYLSLENKKLKCLLNNIFSFLRELNEVGQLKIPSSKS
jgi:hypothetical protein